MKNLAVLTPAARSKRQDAGQRRTSGIRGAAQLFRRLLDEAPPDLARAVLA